MTGMLARTRIRPAPSWRPVVRAVVALVALLALGGALALWRDGGIMRRVARRVVEQRLTQTFGARLDALTGSRSLYDLLMEEAARGGGDVYDAIAVAERDLASDDRDLVDALALRRSVDQAGSALAVILGFAGVLLLAVTFVVNGGGGRGRVLLGPVGLWLDERPTPSGRGDAVAGVPSASPLEEAVVDLVLSRALAGGVLAVTLPAVEVARLLGGGVGAPEPTEQDEVNRALRGLTREVRTFLWRRGGRVLNWTGVALREGEVPDSLEVDPGLVAVLGSRVLVRPLPDSSFGILSADGPLAYELFKVLWDAAAEGEGPASLSLRRMLDDAGVRFSRATAAATMGRIHEDLEALRRHGLIERWSVEEDGRPAPTSWFERVEPFYFDEEARAWRLDLGLLERKTYRVDLVGVRHARRRGPVAAHDLRPAPPAPRPAPPAPRPAPPAPRAAPPAPAPAPPPRPVPPAPRAAPPAPLIPQPPPVESVLVIDDAGAVSTTVPPSPSAVRPSVASAPLVEEPGRQARVRVFPRGRVLVRALRWVEAGFTEDEAPPGPPAPSSDVPRRVAPWYAPPAKPWGCSRRSARRRRDTRREHGRVRRHRRGFRR